MTTLLEVLMPSLFKNVCLTFMLAAVATAIAAEGAGASAKRVFHIMPHSHIDVEWYWTAATTDPGARRYSIKR